MRIIISAKSAAAKAGVLVTPVFSDQLDAPHLRETDSKSGGRIAALRAIGEGTGSRYSCTLTSAGRLPADHLLLVGAGARADFDDRSCSAGPQPQRAALPDARSHVSPSMPPASSLR